MKISTLLREPLVHFCLLGALIFGFYGLAADPDAEGARGRIVVTASEVERLSALWEKRRLRLPTADERRELIDDHVREEVLYREALALGLEEDDGVIRRRLRQKYEFVTQDLAVAAEPDRAALVAHHAAHAERYRRPARVSFTQLYFDPDRRGASGENDALVVLASLQDGAAPDAVRPDDGRMLAPDYRDVTERDVEALFGEAFADALAQLEPGTWAGPVRSGYGLHLVRVDARTPGAPLPFDAVADQVRSDWAYEERRKAGEAIYGRLLERYDVIVEPPAAQADRG